MSGLSLGYSSDDSSYDVDEKLIEKSVDDGKLTFAGRVETIIQDPIQFEIRKRYHAGGTNDFKATKAKKRAKRDQLKLKRGDDNLAYIEEPWKNQFVDGEHQGPEKDDHIVSKEHLGEAAKETTPQNGNNKSNIYISKLVLAQAPNVYTRKFPMLIPGFKAYYTPKVFVNSHSVDDENVIITSLQFHPQFGHVYLTATNSPNGIIKLWDTLKPGKLLRDYIGHNGSILSARFNDLGTLIVSCGVDGYVKVWDAARGKVIFERKLNKPTIAKFVPQRDDILVGFENGHLEQFDYTSDDPLLQSYDHQHQGPITDIEFIKPWYLNCDETNHGSPSIRFISSALDKTVNVWILRINMPEKHITLKKSIHRLRIHPSGSHFICEEVGGGIVTYTTGLNAGGSTTTSSEELSKKIHSSLKTFTNMEGDQYLSTALNQGPTFTPDGKSLLVGTSKGEVYFWDWKSSKVVRRVVDNSKYKIGAISAVDVHPLESSMVIVGDENGVIGIMN